MRASRVFQNDLWKSSFGDVAAINEQSVASAQKKYEEALVKIEQEKFERRIEDINQHYENQMQDLGAKLQQKDAVQRQEMQEASKQHSEYIRQRDNEEQIRQKWQMERIRNKADQEANKAREEWFDLRIKRVRIAAIVFIAIGIVGLISTFATGASIWITLPVVVYFVISAVSVYDTILSRKSMVEKWLIQKSYQYETKIREMKIKEYSSIIHTTETSKIDASEEPLIGV